MEKKINILLAEDNSLMRKILKSLLTGNVNDFELFEVESGDEVIQAIKEKDINWLFLDLYLPKINGDKIIEMIKEDNSFDKLKIVIVSAESNKTKILELLKSERIENYLPKPIKRERLASTIEELLRSK